MRIDPSRQDVSALAGDEFDQVLIECIDEYVDGPANGWPGIYASEICEQLYLGYEAVRRVSGRLAALTGRGIVHATRSAAERNSYSLTAAGLEAARQPVPISYSPALAAELAELRDAPGDFQLGTLTLHPGEPARYATIEAREQGGAVHLLLVSDQITALAWASRPLEASTTAAALRGALDDLVLCYEQRLRA